MIKPYQEISYSYSLKLFLKVLKNKNKKILILGMGKTGQATAKWLAGKKIKFSIADLKFDTAFKKCLKQKKIWQGCLDKIWEGIPSKSPKVFDGISDIILSPGVPREQAFLKIAQKKKIKIWNDVDFFYPLFKDKIIVGITGTDGKSTTVSLMKHVLGAKYATLACGNNGIPIAKHLDDLDKWEILVIEFSSYMLEVIYQLRVNFSIILNLANDHLDRYPDFAAYAKSKFNLLNYCRKGDVYIENLDDKNIINFNQQERINQSIKRIHFTEKPFPKTGYKLKGKKDELVYFYKNNFFFWGEEPLEDFRSKTSPSILFTSNIFPVLIVAHQLGINNLKILRKFKSFKSLPHRLEKISQKYLRGDFEIYNNSKATTLQSVISSLTFFDKPVKIILGGQSKNFSYKNLSKYQKNIKKAYFYGQAGKIIREQSKIAGFYHRNLYTVIVKAYEGLKKGDILILSPGCSSFDQFKNFEERGKFFKKSILEIDNKSKKY